MTTRSRKQIGIRLLCSVGILAALLILIGIPIANTFFVYDHRPHNLPLSERLLHDSESVRKWALIDYSYKSHSLVEGDIENLLSYLYKFHDAEMDDAQHGVVVRIFRESGLLSEYVIVRRVCRELSSGVDERKVAFANRLLDILIEMSEAYVDTTRDSSVMCEELSLIYNARYDAMVQESRQVPIED